MQKKKKKKKKKKKDRENCGLADFPIRWRKTLEDHSQLPKKANKCSVGAVARFLYVWRQRHACVIPTLRVYRLSDNYKQTHSIA